MNQVKELANLVKKYKSQGLFLVSRNANEIDEKRKSNGFGWKIHVLSFDFNDLIIVGNLVIPLLQKESIAHKMVLPAKLEELTGSQSGKAITIYPRDEKEFKDIAKKINELIIKTNLDFKKEIKLDQKYERLLKFKKNSYRLSYRNEFERKERGGEISYKYVGKFFNISHLENPFEKGI